MIPRNSYTEQRNNNNNNLPHYGELNSTSTTVRTKLDLSTYGVKAANEETREETREVSEINGIFWKNWELRSHTLYS